MSRKDFLKKTGIGALIISTMFATPIHAEVLDDILKGKVTTTHENDGNTGVTDNLKSEGFVYSDVAPGNTHAGWVDTSNGNVLKFYDSEKSEWVAYGTYWRSSTEPSDTKQLWIDSTNGDVIRYWNGTEWAFLGTSYIGSDYPKSWKALWVDTGHNAALRFCTDPTKAETEAGWQYAEFVQIYDEAPKNHSSLWVDTSQGGIIKYWDGSKWTVAAAGSWISAEEPPSTAMTWVKPDGRMYFYDSTSNTWVTIKAATSAEKPAEPVDGDIFIDEYGRIQYYRDGKWNILSTGSWMAETEPPSIYMTWIRPDGRMYYYNQTEKKWVTVNAVLPSNPSLEPTEGETYVDADSRLLYFRDDAWHYVRSRIEGSPSAEPVDGDTYIDGKGRLLYYRDNKWNFAAAIWS